jgi:hypothetical protein
MNNSLRSIFAVSSLLVACSDSGQPAQDTSAQGAGGTGLAGVTNTDNNPNLVVPMSEVIPKGGRPAPASMNTTGAAAGTPAMTPQGGPGMGFPGAQGFPGAMTPGAGMNPGTGMVPGAGGAGTGAMSGMPAAGSGPGTVTVEPSATGDRATPEGVCARWKADRADLGEGTWTGNVMSCDVGDMDPNARAAALRLLNTYRWLADLPAMTTDPTKDKEAQACALLQRANNSLSHTPPASWTCYMEEGADAAGRCNISSGPAVGSVDGYMIDPGNETTIGHRRWILSNSMGPTGIGGTDRHSCLMTTGNMKVNKAWQAWPGPGIIPIQAMQMGFGQWVQGLDSTGWTVQSDGIDLSAATVTVTSDGMAKPVTMTQLMPFYGSRYAFRFNPMGWKTEAGKKYTIEVGGVSPAIKYDVEVVDCK